ncbi:Peptidoglycan/LPS O-acetylase OafA/YrhL, contains acyltransferase and SGNH-hydrolase domains [Albimonas donghaensis]|uniref:Peptidoglycan/LPS O-acetylase OafA/YrhL, contains acyltransferase and SGNH-hydrolase domains n=1 Tax=Albimonas donghaensis TaxID=356660 RepID=A0A1H3FRL4_9RHOB|nr:acyltransferase family protein [Albimonas donghaensis]SDX92794.1 Peptidoglycan/LPS O-acetylase OafA/YrhL, contains acyltransferase and SGNH-hydrolase domains [Albimonas donghaensis]
MRHRKDIDGLRAIAVGAVIATHAGAPLPGGFLGVDLFFVLSGFLIAGMMATGLDRGTFSLRAFWIRRARRILPALALMCLACLPAAWLLAAPDRFDAMGQSLVATALSASNLYFFLTSDYFTPAAETLPLLHTWSLAVEEQFYLAFPPLLLLAWRRPAAVPALLFAALLASLAAAEIAARGPHASAAFYLPPFRAWELLAGALAGILTRPGAALAPGLAGGLAARLAAAQAWSRRSRAGGAPGAAGLALILAGLALVPPSAPVPGLACLPVVAGTVLILVFPGGPAARLLSLPPLTALGLISYSAYLWHQPVFAFARLASFTPPSPVLMAALTALTLALAWASWRFVEQPFRDPARLPTRPFLALTGGTLAALVAVGLVADRTGGLAPARFAPWQVALFDSARPSPLRDSCHHVPGRMLAIGPDGACRIGADGRPTRQASARPPALAVLGDSHGVELAYVLARRLPPGETLVELTASACPPALTFASDNPDNPGCTAWTAAAVAWLEARPTIPVALSWRHAIYLHGKTEADLAASPSDRTDRILGPLSGPPLPDSPEGAAEKRALYAESLIALATRLRASGRRVILAPAVPELVQPVESWIRLRWTEDGPHEALPPSYHAARTAELKALLPRLRALGVETPPLPPAFCDARACYGARDGRALYFDTNHPSLAGAEALARALGSLAESAPVEGDPATDAPATDAPG